MLQRAWGGGKVLNHCGDNTMNFANVWVAPKKDFAILVCVNQSGDTAFKASDAAVGAMIGLLKNWTNRNARCSEMTRWISVHDLWVPDTPGRRHCSAYVLLRSNAPRSMSAKHNAVRSSVWLRCPLKRALI